MAERGGKKLILTEKDLAELDYTKIDTKYDFTDTPDNLRYKVLGGFLAFSYLEEYNKYYKATKKSLSQNMYARRMLNISPMGFSTYKNGERMPTGENLDSIADRLGVVVYDIVGVPRRMPRDRGLRDLADIWTKISEGERRELLERAKNFLDNKSDIVAA